MPSIPVSPATPAAPASEGGFSVVEMLVGFAVTTILLVAILQLFTSNSRVARVQTQVAEAQQSLRVSQHEMVRLVRMAGRGYLPLRTAAAQLPTGYAVSVDNNVADGTLIGGAGSPRVLAGTDVLTVRGVFASPVYQFNISDHVLDADGTGGTITIRDTTPTGIPQTLEHLTEVVERELPEALVLVSSRNDRFFGVVELDPASSTVDEETGVATVRFRITGGTRTGAYGAISAGGAYPAAQLQEVAFAGILEEYRFYVRDNRGDGGGPLAPALARARVYPGTDAPHAGEPLALDLADSIYDLQVALGIDTDGDGTIADTGDNADDWLFNAATDDPADGAWNAGEPPLGSLRLTTLALTSRGEPGFENDSLTAIEDRVYASTDPVNTPDASSRRRRLAQTTVDFRNF